MTKIEWTNQTWNPVTGCSKISPGCKNCYAERFAKRLQNMGLAKYLNGFDVTIHPETLNEPYTWKKPRMVFVNSMSDLFHEDVPIDFIAKVFRAMYDNPRHTFQVLTKRPDYMLEFMVTHFASEWPPKNVWLGVSVENQEQANNRIPKLLKVPAGVRFLSCEPLLEKIDISVFLYSGFISPVHNDVVNWVIVGGESGPGARPMRTDWARSIRDQCSSAGIPFFMKQMAKKAPIPKDLQIREFPHEQVKAKA